MFGGRVMINSCIEVGGISIVCNDIGPICSRSFGAKEIRAAIALDEEETGGQTQGRPEGGENRHFCCCPLTSPGDTAHPVGILKGYSVGSCTPHT